MSTVSVAINQWYHSNWVLDMLHRSYVGERIAYRAAISSVLVSRTSVFKSGGIDIFLSLRSTWMSSHEDCRNVSQALISPNNYTTISWRSRGLKPRQSINCIQITMSDFVFIEKSRRDGAMHDAHKAKLRWLQSLITAVGTSSTNKT